MREIQTSKTKILGDQHRDDLPTWAGVALVTCLFVLAGVLAVVVR